MASRTLILFAILVPVIALAQEERRSSWLSLTEAESRSVESHATGYKEFMRVAKTELGFVREAVALARAAGFRELTDDARIEAGARFYDVNRDRALTVIVIGKNDLRDGFRIVGAHFDSPRIDLKARPIYE